MLQLPIFTLVLVTTIQSLSVREFVFLYMSCSAILYEMSQNQNKKYIYFTVRILFARV